MLCLGASVEVGRKMEVFVTAEGTMRWEKSRPTGCFCAGCRLVMQTMINCRLLISCRVLIYGRGLDNLLHLHTYLPAKSIAYKRETYFTGVSC